MCVGVCLRVYMCVCVIVTQRDDVFLQLYVVCAIVIISLLFSVIVVLRVIALLSVLFLLSPSHSSFLSPPQLHIA